MMTPAKQSQREKLGALHRHRARLRHLAALESWVGVHEFKTRLIPLSRGMFAKVDEEDFERVNQWVWTFASTGYAIRNEKLVCILMHRVISGTPDGLETDHINRVGLDNRKSNLRPSTKSQNLTNCLGKVDKESSIYKGVYSNTDRKTFYSKITFGGKGHYLGSYGTEQEAAHAFDEASKNLHGEFAKLNII